MDKPAQLDLDADSWLEVCRILQSEVPDLTVCAFGSRVQGRGKPYSDLDLALMTQQPLSLEVFAGLVEAFDESGLPMRVDVLDWSNTGTTFQKLIAGDAVMIQAGKA